MTAAPDPPPEGLCELSFAASGARYRGTCSEQWKFYGFYMAIEALLANDPTLLRELEGRALLAGLNESLPLFRHSGEACGRGCELLELPALPVMGFAKVPGRPGVLLAHELERANVWLEAAAAANSAAAANRTASRRLCWRGQLERGVDLAEYAVGAQPLLDRHNWRSQPRARLVALGKEMPELDAKFTAVSSTATPGDSEFIAHEIRGEGLLVARTPLEGLLHTCGAVAVVDGPSWASNLISALAIDSVTFRARGFEDVDLWLSTALQAGTHFLVFDLDAEALRRAMRDSSRGLGARVLRESRDFAFAHLTG
eukprot:CAMPEP_0117555104 /NCGR_PEP_ID=MMETSP0784-20121206/51100_1 /TAXON_ID=39447 /ORGANISM="" /LENGTH=312 /DNA_ID=CAMNT_0005352295 /DNA_START=9 /DNA_END=943 /DNA_ORIENTATION=+